MFKTLRRWLPGGKDMKKKMKRYMTHIYVRIMDILHFPLRKTSVADPYHEVFVDFMSLTQQAPSPSVLEIGSRNVRNITRRNLFPNCTDYVGFDILAGDGVDVVGDVHKLSESFPPERFDFIYSVSVFEHLLFPWKAVLEINKVLKTGGHVFLSTHPVWPAHELPWDFWRFPGNGFHALFNKFTGFEIVALTEGLPCKVYSLVDDAPTRGNCFQTMNQGVALIARKTCDYRSDLLKWDIDISDVVDTMYPSKPSTVSGSKLPNSGV
ncbi:MAG: methyltransferase domain-containing protein [Dokdonella sp.]